MNQEYLDQIVTKAVLARISQMDFGIPRALRDEDVDGTERKALKLQIRSDELWLSAVRREAKSRRQPSILAGQERIVVPRIDAARNRLDELAQLDGVVQALAVAPRVQSRWNGMTLAEQRHVIQALVVPRVSPTAPGEHGQRGPNVRRVELDWR